jgi:ABC-2 type transport system ATP-binding protein
MHTLARELSLGQRMRADLAMALLHEPELLLLDEPTLGLDVLARRRILGFVRDVNRERGVTVVVTSHDMDELEQLAGRIVLLHRGALAFDGDFARLRSEASARRVLRLHVAGAVTPQLIGAQRIGGEGEHHEYVYDASQVQLSALLEQAASQARVVDVETHRAPIDEVVADLYERWLREPREAAKSPRSVR